MRTRARTLNHKKLRRALKLEQLGPEELGLITVLEARPRTRADCVDGPRPCVFLSCRYNLYLDVDEQNGSIKLNFPELELHELADTCALDVAEQHGITLEDVGHLMNLTRERIRQVEEQACARLAVALEVA